MSDTMQTPPKEHLLKTWPEYFAVILSGEKTFELCKDDGRGFKVGDTLRLMEYDPATDHLTGRMVYKRVTYRLDGGAFGLEEGCCILGLASVEEFDSDTSRKALRLFVEILAERRAERDIARREAQCMEGRISALESVCEDVLNSDMAMREEDEGRVSDVLNSVRAALGKGTDHG